MNQCIIDMNHVLDDWKARFDILNQVQMSFSGSEDNIISFNGKPICPGKDLVIESANFDIEQIVFHFEENKIMRILMIWPEDKGPVLSSILFGYYKL